MWLILDIQQVSISFSPLLIVSLHKKNQKGLLIFISTCIAITCSATCSELAVNKNYLPMKKKFF